MAFGTDEGGRLCGLSHALQEFNRQTWAKKKEAGISLNQPIAGLSIQTIDRVYGHFDTNASSEFTLFKSVVCRDRNLQLSEPKPDEANGELQAYIGCKEDVCKSFETPSSSMATGMLRPEVCRFKTGVANFYLGQSARAHPGQLHVPSLTTPIAQDDA